MSLVVEYRQSSDHLHITEAAAAVPEMRLTVERWRIEDDDRLRLFVLAAGDRFDELETALTALPSCVRLDTVSERSQSRLYQVKIVSKIEIWPEYSTVDGTISHVRIEPDGVYVTAYMADREELIKTREFLTDRNIDMAVVRLQEATATDPENGLTDDQFEALVTAYEMGYFDVPKAATQAEVAETLDISPPSLSERLKRAQQSLVEQHLLEERLPKDAA